ncbi:MAG TPA: hypothetical protein VJ764_00860 [Steroidobacteraceae bacterium]|nr:hypothetical protein [Steroidobacteraceae bacterium]
MRELATTLTDYLLTAVCVLCAWRLASASVRARFYGPAVFFAGFAAAALVGGTWHGFFSEEETLAQQLVWWLAMLFAGVTASGLALSGLELLGVRALRGPVLLLATLLAIYALLAWRDPRFLLSLIVSVVATLVCVAGLVRRLRGPDTRGAILALAGLGVSVLAALAQQQRVAIDRVHFDHNATYHLLLLPALGLLFAGFLRIARARAAQRGAS